MTPKRTAVLLLFALLLGPAVAARAQSAGLVERLPADTLFYVYSRGGAAIPAASPDALVSLWNDPGFAPLRQWLADSLAEGLARNPRLAHISGAELESLLRAPILLGARFTPRTAPAAGSGSAASANSIQGFFVIAASGHRAEDARDVLLASHSKQPLRVRLLSSGYVVASPDSPTLASLVRRFGAAAPPAAASLPALPAYQEARHELAGSPAVEWFLRVPAASALQPRANSNFNTPAFLQALHLERIHLLCGGLDLGAPAARLRFSILGDTAPGSLFDLFGANTATFSTLAAAPAGSDVSVSRLDFPSEIMLLVNALTTALPPDQAARVKMVVGLFSPSVLPVPAGEYASIRLHPFRGHLQPALYVIAIHDQPAQLLFQNTLAPFVQSAGQEGSVRFFRTAARNKPNASTAENGQATPKSESSGLMGAVLPPSDQPFFLALTPQLLLASQDEHLVRRAAASLTAAVPTPRLADDPYFRQVRAELPAELFSFSFGDLRETPWTFWLDHLADRIANNKKDPHAADRAAALRLWADSDGGAVLARHLHVYFGGAWKDSSGVHWSSQIH